MNKEELQFSKLQPALSLMFILAGAYFFSDKYNLYMMLVNPIELIIISLLLIYAIKNLRIGYLTLIGKPAVILTNESIFIAAKNDEVKWTEMKDVYMTSSSVGMINLVKFRFITIKLREPEKFLKAVKNPFIRNYRWLTRNWRDGPCEISLFLVQGDDEEIYQLVLKYYRNLRGF